MIEIDTEIYRSSIQPIEVQIDYFYNDLDPSLQHCNQRLSVSRNRSSHARKNELETGTKNDTPGTYDEW